MNEIKSVFPLNPEMDVKSADSLLSALAAASLQGFDYLKFKKSYQAILEMGLAEEMAFKSAFSTASTLSLTKEKLLKTAKHYLQVLTREKKEFNDALKKQLHQRVDIKQNETTFFKEKIKEYKIKIKELEEEIAKLNQKINSADKEIVHSKEKIISTRDKFQTTYQHFEDTIKRDIGLIEKYL